MNYIRSSHCLSSFVLAEARFRKSTSQSILGQPDGLRERLSDWNLSSHEVRSSYSIPGFKRWNSIPADEAPAAEHFSPEVWSDHLENRAKDFVFELGDTSIKDSDVESDDYYESG